MSIQERSDQFVYIDSCRNGLQTLSGRARLALPTLGDTPYIDRRTASWPSLCGERVAGALALMMVSEFWSIEDMLEWEDSQDFSKEIHDMGRIGRMLKVAGRGKLETKPYEGGDDLQTVKNIIDSKAVLWTGVVEAGLESQRGGNIRGLDASDHHFAIIGHDGDELEVVCGSWREQQHRPDVGFLRIKWEKFIPLWRWSETGFRPKDGVNRLEVDGWMQHVGLVVRRRV